MKSAQKLLLMARRGASFTPASLSTLKVWLDAQVLGSLWQLSTLSTPVASNADPVGAWADQSGNGNHAIQATAAKRLQYATAAINGFPAVQVTPSGGAKALVRTFGASLASPITMFVVMKLVSFTANKYFIYYNTPQGFLSNGAGDAIQFNQGQYVTWASHTPGTNPHIYAFLSNGASSKIYEDGGSAGASGNAGTTAIPAISIGSSTFGGDGMEGYIGELIILNEAATSATINNVLNYLAAKWGVTVTPVP